MAEQILAPAPGGILKFTTATTHLPLMRDVLELLWERRLFSSRLLKQWVACKAPTSAMRAVSLSGETLNPVALRVFVTGLSDDQNRTHRHELRTTRILLPATLIAADES